MAQQKATTSEAVVEAAADVFREKGYANATLEDIALAAGVSKPTVYRYAESKQWLMDRIVKKVQSELNARAASVWDEGLSAEQRLRRLVRVNIDTAVEYRRYYEVAFVQNAESSPAARQDFGRWGRAVTENVARVLEVAVEEGVLDLPGDPMPYAHLLQSMLASIHRWYHVDGALSPDQLTDHILTLLTAGDRRRVLGSDGVGTAVRGNNSD